MHLSKGILYGEESKTLRKMKFKNSHILYLNALPCVLLLCSPRGCVCTWILGICDETSVWRWRMHSWNGLWETGSLSRYWKLPGHIPGPGLETCLKKSSWLFPNYFPQWWWRRKRKSDVLKVRCIHRPSALAAVLTARTSEERDVMPWSNWEKTIKLHCKHLYK